MTGKFADALTTGAPTAGAPTTGTPTTGTLTTDAAAGLEATLAEVLAGVMHTDQVPAGSHFFDELGADSLVMAHFCARVRKRGDLPPVSMKDIYAHPTISSLAVALADAAPVAARPPRPAPAEAAAPASTGRYVTCGVFAVPVLPGLCVDRRAGRRLGLRVDLRRLGFRRHLPAGGRVRRRRLPGGVHRADPGQVGAHRPVETAADPHLEPGLRPVLGRQDAGPVEPAGPSWPRAPRCIVLYLRALGAKIGPANRDLLPHVPVCTDLLTIGAGHGDPQGRVPPVLPGRGGLDRDRPGHVGRDVFIGEKTVLDIDSVLGDGAQIGHTSALHSGQAVPDGERWHGSPAQRTELNYLTVDPAPCSTAAPRQVRRPHPAVRVLPVPAAGRRRACTCC